MKKRITQDDYVKANRKASREAEIEMYGHPICHQRVHQSKKVYNRRKIKAADKKLPYFFVFKIASLSSRHLFTYLPIYLIIYTIRVNSPVVESIINP